MGVGTLCGMRPVLEERLDIVTQYQPTVPLSNQCLDSISFHASSTDPNFDVTN